MLNFLIPTAHAQGFLDSISNTANTGANAAAEKAETGVQGLITYIVTNIDNWIAGIVVIVVFYILGRMAAVAIKKAILKKRDDVQESALILVERITKITVLAIGITIAFALNGLNFTAVLGALSLGVGFALKDIIGNFISGVIMLSQNRINIGDYIKVGEKVSGTIVSIDTRATILQAIDGTEIVIPNQTMLGETLVSYTTNPFRRVDFPIGVSYDSDLAVVTSIIKAILDKEEKIVVKPAPNVIVKEFGESSINLSVRFWVETGSGWMRIKSNLIHKIKKAFDDAGINIPFPIRTLKLDEDDRAFLKTMDSLKKGLIPESKASLTSEEMISIALNAEKMENIPYKILEEHEKQGQVLSKEDMKPMAADPMNMYKIDPTAAHEDVGIQSPEALEFVNQNPENQVISNAPIIQAEIDLPENSSSPSQIQTDSTPSSLNPNLPDQEPVKTPPPSMPQ